MLLLNMPYDNDILVPKDNNFSLYGDSRQFRCIKLDVKDFLITIRELTSWKH
jgi:hypothetical protein